MGPADEEAMVLKKIAELNLGQNTSAFSKFGCKNAGFVEAMVLRGTSLHRGGFELTEVRRRGVDGGGGDWGLVTKWKMALDVSTYSCRYFLDTVMFVGVVVDELLCPI